MLLGASAWACGPLRLAYFNYPGLYERGPDGEERGFDVDTVRELASRTGCRFETQYLSVIKAWQAVESGEMDIVVSALQTTERERLAEFAIMGNTAPLIMMQAAADGADLNPERFLDDPRLRLIVVRGASFGATTAAWVARLRALKRVSEAGDMAAALRAFEAGRAQALIVYPTVLVGREPAWLARRTLYSWWPHDAAFGGWALSLKTVPAADRQRIRSAMDSMLKDGSLLRLAERSMGAQLARHWISSP